MQWDTGVLLPVRWIGKDTLMEATRVYSFYLGKTRCEENYKHSFYIAEFWNTISVSLLLLVVWLDIALFFLGE